MTKSLEGKVAVLTGASRNIGKAVAVELVSRGAKVVIGDILDKQGEETVQELNTRYAYFPDFCQCDMLTLFFVSYSAGSKVAAYIHTDVTKYDDNVALFKLAETEFGGVDVCVLRCAHCFAATVSNNELRILLLDCLFERWYWFQCKHHVYASRW